MQCVWALLLCAALAAGRSFSDLEYAQVNGQSLRLDGYIPEGSGPFPAAILVHGGGWVTGDKTHSVRPLFQPLARAGVAWFSINYRLARGPNPEALISLEGLATLANASEDVRSAVRFVRAHAAEWNLDSQRMVLIGESAGAHLASMAALRPAPGSGVEAVVAFYSPSDLVDLVETSPSIPELLRRAVRGTPLEALLLQGLRQLSPRTWVRAGAPPFLMIHGTADALVPFHQSEAMCDALRSAGNLCELVPVPGGGHGVGGWERAGLDFYKDRMLDWLRGLLGLK
jgi:alpha-L-fucosidase 2